MTEPLVGARRVLVTGGGSGIGRAVAEAIVAAGGRVVIAGRRAHVLDEVVRANPPGAIVAISTDVTAPDARARLWERAQESLGGIDGFVHSAGRVVHELPGAISEEALRSQLEVNLVAPLRLGEDALRELEPGGAMVFLSSTLSTRPVRTSAVYSAAKAGLEAVVKVLALEGAARKVRANALVPGVVDTDMVRGARSEKELEILRSLHVLGRLGTPADVAGTVLHLLTATWVTGAAWTIDGGLLLRE